MKKTEVTRITIYVKDGVKAVFDKLAKENSRSLSSQIVYMAKQSKEYKDAK